MLRGRGNQPETQPPDMDEMRQLGLVFLEQIDPVLEMLDGFRAKLRDRGYAEAAVEAMTVEMFTSMMRATHGQ